MEKKKKPIFFKIFIIVAVIIIANLGYFLFKSQTSNVALTGHSVGGGVIEVYSQVSPFAKIFLIMQWVFLGGMIIFGLFHDKTRMKSKKKEINEIDLDEMSANSKTDLDTLYNILKTKKEIRISTISKLFRVNKETAMEWAKILEAGNLAEIISPLIGEVTVKLLIEEDE